MIIKRQKSYAIIPDLIKYRRSGIKRVVRKNIGRARRNTASRISNSIANDLAKLDKATWDFSRINEQRDPRLMKGLLQNAKQRDIRVLSTDTIFGPYSGYGSMNWDSDVILKALKSNPENSRNWRKAVNAAKASKGGIVALAPTSGPAELGHELGHIEGRSLATPRGVINSLGAHPGTREEQISSQLTQRIETLGKEWKLYSPQDKTKEIIVTRNGIPWDNRKGVGETLRSWIRGKSVMADEKYATKSALRNLKNLGATREEMAQAEKKLGAALKTYKASTRIPWKSALENTIQIPSRQRR